MKKKFGTVFFSGRKNCTYSKKIKIFLKKRCSKLYYLDSNKIGEKLILNNRDKFISLMLIFGQLKLLQVILKRFQIKLKELEKLEDNYFN